MRDVRELLAEMDIEIMQKVDVKVAEKDAEIKAYAQLAYEDAIKEMIGAIKAEVELGYETARRYLLELVEPEISTEEVSLNEELVEEKPTEAQGE